jgi:hypothetical protein
LAEAVTPVPAASRQQQEMLQRNKVKALLAGGLIDAATTIACDMPRDDSALTMLNLSNALVDHGELAIALDIARHLPGEFGRSAQQSTLLHAVQAAVLSGDLDRAEVIADSITDPKDRAEALASIGSGYGKAGEDEIAYDLIEEAEDAAVMIPVGASGVAIHP